MKDIKVKTERLIISPVSDEEMRGIIDAESDIEMKKAYNEMLVGSVENPKDRNWYAVWKMKLKETGEAVGDLCFKGPADKTGTVEIGYGVYPYCQHKGYATEAVKALSDWAVNQSGVMFVDAETDPENEISQKVLNKVGYKFYKEGKEGPRFYFFKEPESKIGIGTIVGAFSGAVYGFIFNKLLFALSIGALIGFITGIVIDNINKKQIDKIFKLKGLK